MKTTRKFSFHDFIIYSIVLSSCFVLSGCSSKKDEAKTSKQASFIISLRKEIVKLRTENDEIQHSLAESRDKIKQLDKTEGQVGSELLNKQMQRLKQEKALAQATEKTKGQDNSEVELLKQKNNELKKLLDEEIARIKVLTNLASLKSRRTRERQYKEHAEAVIAEFDSNISSRRKLELLDSLAESAVEQHPSVIDIVRKALDDPDPEVVRAAIALLEDYETAGIIPVISQALESSDEQARIDALATLANVNDPRVIDLLIGALSDPSESVRFAARAMFGGYEPTEIIPAIRQALESEDPQIRADAVAPLADIDDPQIPDILIDALDDPSEIVRDAVFKAFDEQAEDFQLDILEKGIASLYDDVKSEILDILEVRSDHASIGIIITGLLDEDPEFRERIKLSLHVFLGQEFETYEDALTWWNQNEDLFDENMFEIVEEDVN